MNVQAEYLAEMRRIEFLRNKARQMLDGPAVNALAKQAASLNASFWDYLKSRLGEVPAQQSAA